MQTWPCGVTDDCLILVPREDLWCREVDLEDLYIAAATVRLERWRFDYGRKITPARIAHLRLNRDGELKSWIKSQRMSADLLMGATIETLGSPNQMEKTFHELAEQWRNETGMLSVVQQKVLHPSYQRIIGMGTQALPFIFRELEQKRDHWLWALRAITGKDVSENSASFKAAVSAWVEWGRKKGYL